MIISLIIKKNNDPTRIPWTFSKEKKSLHSDIGIGQNGRKEKEAAGPIFSKSHIKKKKKTF